jgi:hypothetical protein
MTKEEARAVALRIASSKAGPPINIVDDKTIERPFGWVFFYQSQQYIDTQDRMYALLGNSPIFIDRATGHASSASGGIPPHLLIEAYEALGTKRFDAGEWRAYLRRRR